MIDRHPLQPWQIRSARAAIGWTQRQLEALSGVGFQTIQVLETELPLMTKVQGEALGIIEETFKQADVTFTNRALIIGPGLALHLGAKAEAEGQRKKRKEERKADNKAKGLGLNRRGIEMIDAAARKKL